MSQISRLFAKAPNSHNQTDLAEVFNFLASNGYKRNDGNDLEVVESSPAAMSVKLQTGKAWIEGYYYFNDADLTVNIDAADATHPRIDRIVLQCDFLTNLETVVKVVKGTAAATPVAPTLTRAGGIYEISLAQVYVGAGVVAIYNTNITDERDDPTLCGVAQGLEVAKVGQLHSVSLPVLNGDTAAASKPAHTNYYAICNVGNDVYLFGGSGGGNVLASRYRNGAWTALTVLPVAMGNAKCVHYDGKIYIFGDTAAGTDIRVYDIATDSYAALTKPTSSRFTGICENDGKIYFFGGGNLVTVDVYDVAGSTWSSAADLIYTPNDHSNHGTSCCSDGTNIFLQFSDGTQRFIRYNVSTDSYTVLTTGNAQRGGQNLHYNSGSIYTFDPRTSTSFAYLYRYDIANDTWETLNASTIKQATKRLAMQENGVFINIDYIFTYVYILGEADAQYILGYRKRTIADLGLINLETFSSGVDTICVDVGDNYGVYVNDKNLTGDYEVEIYG